jgi:ABC-type multidrug transport system fused ATPase/permease subunit
MADKIYMLDNGQIIESGSHDELMEQDGKYAKMYRYQSKKYEYEKYFEEML